MKIVRLSSSNVKRLSAVEVTPAPDGSLVTIGGKNGAGKSSVLDSIAYALGGNDLVPTQPIRTGQSEAKVTVDLGDYIVIRRFHREHLECDCNPNVGEQTVGFKHTDVCSSRKFGPTKSVLVVTNRDGAKYPSPQALLDKLYGKLTFDPLAFSREKPPAQNEILRRLVNLDFTLVNGQRKALFDSRAMDKKTLAISEGRLAGLPKPPTPQGVYETTQTPIDEITAEVKRGSDLQKLAEKADRALSEVVQKGKELERSREIAMNKLRELERQILEATKDLKSVDDALKAQETEVRLAAEAFEATKAAVPDFQVLDTRLKEIDLANTHARQNAAYLDLEEEVKNWQMMIAEQTKNIEKIDADKETALRSAIFPVAGLGLTDEGVTFEGLPLAEVAASVQLRVSIAIGIALNPTLKVLLIRNGNLLDDDSLKLVAAQAAEAEAQVWLEWVTSDAGDVSVMLEDGHVA